MTQFISSLTPLLVCAGPSPVLQYFTQKPESGQPVRAKCTVRLAGAAVYPLRTVRTHKNADHPLILVSVPAVGKEFPGRDLFCHTDTVEGRLAFMHALEVAISAQHPGTRGSCAVDVFAWGLMVT